MKKIFLNMFGMFFIVFFFGLLILAFHNAYEERDNPNTTPERKKEIDDTITSTLMLMG